MFFYKQGVFHLSRSESEFCSDTKNPKYFFVPSGVHAEMEKIGQNQRIFSSCPLLVTVGATVTLN